MGAWGIGMATGTCRNAHASADVALGKVYVYTKAIPCTHDEMFLESAAVENSMTAAVVFDCIMQQDA